MFENVAFEPEGASPETDTALVDVTVYVAVPFLITPLIPLKFTLNAEARPTLNARDLPSARVMSFVKV